MTREEKKDIIQSIAEQLNKYTHYYLVDISELNAQQTAKLRKMCFERDVILTVVKNTLFEKALKQTEKEYADEISKVLKGSTSVMFTNTNKAPAKLIEEFRKTNAKPILKAAYVEESLYIGDENLKVLASIKSKEELIGDVVALLQSPIKNVISALKAGAGDKVAGLVKAIEENQHK